MQPHIRKGRFFNHADERLFGRIGKEIVSLTHLVGKRVVQRVTQKSSHAADCQHTQNNWVTSAQPNVSSSEPVLTWLGHATFFIQLNNINILTDPVFDEVSRFFPRITRLPIAVEQLPKIDVVVISHNHRDHMDKRSLLAIKKNQPLMLVPLGNRPWFVRHGFEHVVEMNWWETYKLLGSEISLTFLPAHHWTGRGLFDFNKTLWGSWMIQANDSSIYFAGDTAYSSHFAQIGKKFSTIDVALMPIGPNEPRSIMVHSHVSTYEAVQAFIDLRATYFVPMHWGTFKAGLDAFADPINELSRAWNFFKLEDQYLHTLKFGQQWGLL